MAEPTQFKFTHKEVVELMIKKQGIHEGIWGLWTRFGIKASNVGSSDADLLPAAIVPVLEFGLQKFEEVGNLSVDAAVANPKPAKARRKRGAS